MFKNIEKQKTHRKDKSKPKTPPKDYALSSQKEKQILARIAASNPQNKEDYKRIIQTLESQNQKLHADLDTMSEQVLKLIEKTKVERPQQERMQKQILQKKTELEAKYKEFYQYKKEIQDIKAKNLDPDVNAKLLKNQDLLKQMDKEIKQLQVTKTKLIKYLKDNNESIKQYQQEELPQQLEQLMRQNKELKKRTQEQRRKEEQIRHEEIRAQQNYIDLKIKARKMQDKDYTEPPSIDLKKIKDSTISKEQILDSTLKKAVQALKDKKQEIQSKEERQRIQKTRKRQQLFAKNQQLLSKMKILEMEKVKLRQEINKYQALSIEIQNSKKKDRDIRKKQSSSVAVQTDSKEGLLVLRRDYAGLIGRNRFDDRINVLNDNFNTRINKVIVYENSKSISAIKFQYFDDEGSTFQTQMIVPSAYLLKCKKKSFQVSHQNDFFKLFKVKFNVHDRKITKIQIISNLNIKAQFGDKKSFSELSKDENVYGFDISVDELPVSMFGSVTQVGNEWYLQSLGAQIKGFNQKITI